MPTPTTVTIDYADALPRTVTAPLPADLLAAIDALPPVEPPAPDVVDFDRAQLPDDGSEFALTPNTIYVLTRAKPLAARLYKNGTGPNPVIRYVGKRDSAALSVGAGKVAGTRDIDFDLSPGTYAVNCGAGTFAGTNSTTRGGGGWLKSSGGAVVELTNWTHTDVANNYICYCGPSTDRDDAAAFVQRSGLSVALLNCTVERGTTQQHVLRFHAVDNVIIGGGRYGDADRTGAVLRVHDCGTVAIGRTALHGDVSVGPMCEADGGINYPPGPKRDAYDRMRLRRLTVIDTEIDAETVKLNPGILEFRFERCRITARRGGALIHTPWPYMTRPRSVGKFVGCALHYNAPQGRLFGGEDARRDIVLVNTTFNGALAK